MLSDLENLSQSIEAKSPVKVYGEVIDAIGDVEYAALILSVIDARSYADTIFQLEKKKATFRAQADRQEGQEGVVSSILRAAAQDRLNQITYQQNKTFNSLAEKGGVLLQPVKQTADATFAYLLGNTEGGARDLLTGLIKRIEENEIEIVVDFDAPRDKFGNENQFGDGKGTISFIERDDKKPMLRVKSTVLVNMSTSPHTNPIYGLLASFDAANHFGGFDAKREMVVVSTIKRLLREAQAEGIDPHLPPGLTQYLRDRGYN